MSDVAGDVLSGAAVWSVEASDNLPWLQALPDNCCAMTICSPPYATARTYGIDFRLEGQAWVDWMIPRVVEMCRVTDGLVCVNMAGQVRDHSYQPVVEWLVADLTRHHGIVCGPAPYVFFRFGIPGSGGRRYHRRDWEPVYCFAKPESLPLKWSDNTAEGHPPKWAPGGEMSNRLKSGQRVGKFGAGGRVGIGRNADGETESIRNSSIAETVVVGDDGSPGLFGPVEGKPVNPWTDHPGQLPGRSRHGQAMTSGSKAMKDGVTDPPEVLANPGNVIRERYDAEVVRQLLEDLTCARIEYGDVIRCLAGGNMGSRISHENEAPFPERLVEFFVRSYAPPQGVVCDPFSGSGTTSAVSVRLGRRFIGCDIRPAQVKIAHRRILGETPDMFATMGDQP